MISILWPTIRPKMAWDRAKIWADRAREDRQMILRFGLSEAVDENGDRVLEYLEEKIRQERLNEIIPFIGFFPSTKRGVTHAATMLTFGMPGETPIPGSYLLEAVKPENADIVVLASDDFEPCEHWDDRLIAEFSGFDGMLLCDDRKGTNIVACPVLTGACLKRLGGVLYNPHYSHFYSDQELYDICQELKIFKDIREKAAIFTHKHWSFGGRDRDHNDDRNTSNWGKDKATYERRESLPVEEKLKLPENWK